MSHRNSAAHTSGCQDNFTHFYYAYRDLMYRVAWRILRNTQDAEDAVSRAFVKLAERSDLIPSDIGPRAKTLAATVAERQAIDLWRARQRHPTEELDETALVCDPPIDSDGTLETAMSALPPRYREVLLLRFYIGYSNGEIAQLLGLTPANVGQLIHRAKTKLAQTLAQGGDPV